MKVLVTGGAGFIGSAVIRYLIKEKRINVVNIDCLTYSGNLLSLEEVIEVISILLERLISVTQRN